MSEEVKATSPVAEEEKEGLEPEEDLGDSDDPTAKGDEDEPELSPRAQKRFAQLLAQRKEAMQVADWYRQNVGDPNDVVAFRKWKAETASKAESDEAAEIPQAKLKQVRELIHKADPRLAAFLDREEKKAQEHEEAMVESAEESIKDFIKADGLKLDEAGKARIAKLVGLEISGDAKLSRMWAAGNLKCVEKAYRAVKDSLIGKLGVGGARQIAEEKRKTLKLPTPDPGRSVVTGRTPEKRPEGINKATHEAAWDLLQQGLND